MPHHAVNLLGLIALFGSLIIFLVLAFVGMRSGSFLCHRSFRKMVFRRRLSQRVFMGTMGVIMAVGGPIGCWHGIVDGRGSLSTAARFTAWAVFALLDVAVGALCIYIAGPEELHLDLERRTYRLVRGWPFFPVTRSGTWKDIAGISVRDFGEGQTYVGIKWGYGRRSVTPLGTFGKQAANQFAQEMASMLGLPQVDWK